MTLDFRSQLVALLPRLRRFALGLTASRDEADDLVQAACEKALVKQDQWQPDTRLDSWLYRIIQTQRIDHLRRAKRSPVSVPENAMPDLEDAQSADRAENEDLLRHTLKALEQLPEEQRAVMLLVVVEGHSYREVAEQLGIPQGTVMSRLARARLRVQELLAPTEQANEQP
ncbi:RNA polymerase sigma-70 factor (ECF subfamily) [Marinimicrobium koreense]|uniref:RNA polymerase sigma-70 factor (ECF subfamily) n=1 Tax=Marinimicrobium koreense TaxID=306545 RepID=A0A3N1NU25_9GAMM|nr:RNA polymerase sigma factor [Marinimicrobium koreense]ROQ18457.1 RNA polymerase sigma-70 factor (ECF subfamily) [Marinimicrobium koreense]